MCVCRLKIVCRYFLEKGQFLIIIEVENDFGKMQNNGQLISHGLVLKSIPVNILSIENISFIKYENIIKRRMK